MEWWSRGGEDWGVRRSDSGEDWRLGAGTVMAAAGWWGWGDWEFGWEKP
jgi:hypothetical protein